VGALATKATSDTGHRCDDEAPAAKVAVTSVGVASLSATEPSDAADCGGLGWDEAG
jgi:hypothetical protein